ncbi:MAG: alpha/beta fold hydrolase [Propionibacteriaceae bacterium]|jgi:pimeloyl-ACP methyl ester carboxylesterase|nr:alpha/beta fold hydrolase [Propionibacteriaceae bacterium]
MSYAKVRGARLYYQVLNPGGGPTVVMVHGLYTHHAIFFWCGAKGLAELGYRVVLYDLRGHGFSKGDRAGFRMQDLAEDLLGLMDYLEIDQAFLAGYSLGGTIVVKTALMAPDRVLGLAILEAAGLGSDELVDVDDVDQTITATLQSYAVSIGLALPARAEHQFRDQVHHLLDAGLLDDLRADVGFFQNLPWGDISTPGVLVYGTDSPYIEACRTAAANLVNSELVMMGGDHNMVVRYGEEISATMIRFFETIRQGRPWPEVQSGPRPTVGG